MALTSINLDTEGIAQARAKRNRALIAQDAMQIATRTQLRSDVIAQIDTRLQQAQQERSERRRELQRNYQAALSTHRTSDWSMAQTSANAEIRRALRPLRARSRDLQRNNGLVKKFISMIGNNVVGPQGMTLSDVIEGEDENPRDLKLNEEIIKCFNEWAKPENASTSGKLSWADQQKLAIETIARDGEVLIRKRIAPNPFGFALQFVDVSWLDETFSTILPNGNRVLMSVELNDLDRPVAYHLTRPSSDYLYAEYNQPFRTRVPADEIYHLFIITEHETQVRGVPWAHAVMEMLHTINGYVDAELYASRAGACTTDYLTPPKNDEYNEIYSGEGLGSIYAPDGFAVGAVRDLEVASQQILPPGWTVDSNDPKHPNTNFDAFLTGAERYVASGMDVPYFRLCSDLSGVNYTSSRAGDNEARDFYRWIQRALSDHLCRPVFFDVAKSGMLTGAMPISANDYFRLDPTYDARGWDSVDPKKDSDAAITDIGAALDTHTRIAAEKGLNFRKIVKKLAEEKKLLEEAGVESSAFTKAVAASHPPQADTEKSDSDDEGDDRADKQKKTKRALHLAGL